MITLQKIPGMARRHMHNCTTLCSSRLNVSIDTTPLLDELRWRQKHTTGPFLRLKCSVVVMKNILD
ncbi:hypothetical protein BCR39DRAFT_545029 [Naematelia encephala]|uniref:Uncharacterized protein n=1 Tax=Naematelia encephala TaxID=71784 RepID=A0A1Y2ARK2_9TREE|nr:hypothetical protein BCR39DRAFT_545029 [Naematelia encephala]